MLFLAKQTQKPTARHGLGVGKFCFAVFGRVSLAELVLSLACGLFCFQGSDLPTESLADLSARELLRVGRSGPGGRSAPVSDDPFGGRTVFWGRTVLSGVGRSVLWSGGLPSGVGRAPTDGLRLGCSFLRFVKIVFRCVHSGL